MTTVITVPAGSRPQVLADAIRTAPQNAVIVVVSEGIKALGERAAGRRGRTDITFRVAEPESGAAS